MSGVFSKVTAASAGAGGGAVLSALVIWLLGLAWGGSSAAEDVAATVALVPGPVVAVVLAGLPVLLAGVAGFLKREDPLRLASYIDAAFPDEDDDEAAYADGDHAVPLAATDGQEQAARSSALALSDGEQDTDEAMALVRSHAHQASSIARTHGRELVYDDTGRLIGARLTSTATSEPPQS